MEALRQGASIVITGRVADASLTVAPAVHEFGWAWDDWDRLAAGTVAGHLIECGAQATGGLWCNWQEAPDLANVGYPIAEIEPDGDFTHHQAARHRRSGQPRDGHRATALRGRRPGRVPDAGRRRRLHQRAR